LDDAGDRLGEGRGKSWSSSSSWIGEDLTRPGKSPVEGSEQLDVDEVDNMDVSLGGVLDMNGGTCKGERLRWFSRFNSSPVISIDLRRLSTSSTVKERADDLFNHNLASEITTTRSDGLIISK
jgi:hypothetical protein